MYVCLSVQTYVCAFLLSLGLLGHETLVDIRHDTWGRGRGEEGGGREGEGVMGDGERKKKHEFTMRLVRQEQ